MTVERGTAIERHLLRHADGRRLYVFGDLRGDLAGHELPDRPTDEPAGLHQRYDAVSGSWVAISPARNTRPHASTVPRGAGSGCPLCPGGPEVPFGYEAAVFENRFPSFESDPPQPPALTGAEPSLGRCEVVLYTDRHEGSLATLSPAELARLIAIWTDRSTDLWSDPRHAAVLIFENRGTAVGATLSHPHGQIYAFDRMPPLIQARVAALREHRARTGACLGCALTSDEAGPAAGDEAAASARRVEPSPAFAVGVPFAPRWPYEIHLRARRHGARRLADLEPGERVELARTLRRLVLRYDGLFGFELPYMMVVHEAPEGAADWHLSFEFFPPHRTARLPKVRASVETATGLFINDTIPEASGRALAAIPVETREECPPVEIARVGMDEAAAGA